MSQNTSATSSAATSAATSTSVSRVTSLEGKHPSDAAANPMSKKSHFAKLKKRLAAVKKEWGPGLAAKESWDDEYNFPAGRWAGQGLDPRLVSF
ncbi:hypothetical protein BDW74DRAFT_160489 [Aspergillus multicolor]|uniref:uncharacterized protein n=1 Tax=Aspergillus multicolor TaxID=41759 RepID=UPI003CCD56B1